MPCGSRGPGSSGDAGPVIDVLGAIGEWAAAAAAAVAALISARLLRLERDDRHAAVLRERQSQAELCNAWAYWQAGERELMALEVANDSKQPIFRVRARPAGVEAWIFDRWVVAPGGHPVEGFRAAAGSDPPPVELEFTDAAGQQWIRPTSGKLLIINDRPPVAPAPWWRRVLPWLRKLPTRLRRGYWRDLSW